MGVFSWWPCRIPCWGRHTHLHTTPSSLRLQTRTVKEKRGQNGFWRGRGGKLSGFMADSFSACGIFKTGWPILAQKATELW